MAVGRQGGVIVEVGVLAAADRLERPSRATDVVPPAPKTSLHASAVAASIV